MKQIILIMALILLIGCKTVTEIHDTVVAEPSQPDEIFKPLEVTLTAEKTESELELKTVLNCNAKKGTGNYTYVWNNDCKINTCNISLESIGKHEINCTVDDGLYKITKTITLEVKKQKINIEYIIGYGDSLTEGFGLDNPETENWLYLYSQNIEAKLINNAHEGDATNDVIQTQMEKPIPKGEKLIFLWIGANDILRLESVEKFSDEYNQIVNKLRKIPNARLILMTIPDASQLSTATQIEEGVNDFLQGIGIEGSIDVKGIGKEIIKDYNDVIWATAKQYNLNTIDVFRYMEENFNEDLESDDKFHPNKKGHELIAEEVKKQMQTFYPTKEFK